MNINKSLNSYLIQRNINGSINKKERIIPNFLLETFQCHKDDKHNLYRYNMSDCPGYQCRFCPDSAYNHIALISKEDGSVLVVDTEKSTSSAILHKYAAHTNCVFDIQWTSYSNFLTSSGDSSIKLHDLKYQTVIAEFEGHSASVRSLSLKPDSSVVFASTGRDGSILLWDTRVASKMGSNRVPIHSLHSAHQVNTMHANGVAVKMRARSSRTSNSSNNPKPVTSVIFTNENNFASCGSTDGCIKIWDIRKLKTQQIMPVRNIDYCGNSTRAIGYTDLIVDRTGTSLFAYCRDAVVYQYDLTKPQSNHPSFCYMGHTSETFYLKMDLSPNDSQLACGSSTYSGYIYNVGRVPQQPLMLSGHQGELTVCRWSPANPGVIVTISDDCSFMVHRMKPGSDSDPRYRFGNNTQKPLFDLVSTSSRCGMETVTLENQKSQPKSDNFIAVCPNSLKHRRSAILPPASKFPATPDSVTPKITNYLSSNTATCLARTSAFLTTPNSPMARAPLDDVTNRSQQTQNNIPSRFCHSKVDRSRSVILPDRQKIKPKKRTLNHTPETDRNKENNSALKRRKTINQLTITTYFNPI